MLFKVFDDEFSAVEELKRSLKFGNESDDDDEEESSAGTRNKSSVNHM